ncbi:MAG: hypothetical protein AUH85_03430 [Chloroflexi bacterium 13_1_40CM_4_68_4]|nr:MAG: hypothetical protein AUH85_03430 [Chloroflexi bacterium 13_1_40CM_4_68_4]
MQAKPVVDGIERDVAGRALVVRLDLLSDTGATVAKRFGVEFTPSFVLLDRHGVVVETFRAVDRDAMVSRLLELGG